MPNRLLAASLIEAYQTGTLVADLPLLKDVAEAVGVQQAVQQGLGAGVGGWKVAINKDFGAIGAPMFESNIREAPCEWAFAPGLYLEVEVALRLKRDLPPGTYTRADIIAAIDSLCLGVEVVRSRLDVGGAAPFLTFLGDNLGNAGYVIDSARLPWSEMDINARRCNVLKDGKAVFDGPCAHPLNDVLAAFTGFASRQTGALGGLKAGQIVTTGSVCGLLPVDEPGTFLIEIEQLGTITLLIP